MAPLRSRFDDTNSQRPIIVLPSTCTSPLKSLPQQQQQPLGGPNVFRLPHDLRCGWMRPPSLRVSGFPMIIQR